jgi:hypothetical protein
MKYILRRLVIVVSSLGQSSVSASRSSQVIGTSSFCNNICLSKGEVTVKSYSALRAYAIRCHPVCAYYRLMGYHSEMNPNTSPNLQETSPKCFSVHSSDRIDFSDCYPVN